MNVEGSDVVPGFSVGFRKVSAASHFLLSTGCGGGWLHSFLDSDAEMQRGQEKVVLKANTPTLCCVLAAPQRASQEMGEREGLWAHFDHLHLNLN